MTCGGRSYSFHLSQAVAAWGGIGLCEGKGCAEKATEGRPGGFKIAVGVFFLPGTKARRCKIVAGDATIALVGILSDSSTDTAYMSISVMKVYWDVPCARIFVNIRSLGLSKRSKTP